MKSRASAGSRGEDSRLRIQVAVARNFAFSCGDESSFFVIEMTEVVRKRMSSRMMAVSGLIWSSDVESMKRMRDCRSGESRCWGYITKIGMKGL